MTPLWKRRIASRTVGNNYLKYQTLINKVFLTCDIFFFINNVALKFFFVCQKTLPKEIALKLLHFLNFEIFYFRTQWGAYFNDHVQSDTCNKEVQQHLKLSSMGLLYQKSKRNLPCRMTRGLITLQNANTPKLETIVMGLHQHDTTPENLIRRG